MTPKVIAIDALRDARALIKALERYVRGQGPVTPQAMSDVAERLTADAWVYLAQIAGVRFPNPETQQLVIDRVRIVRPKYLRRKS